MMGTRRWALVAGVSLLCICPHPGAMAQSRDNATSCLGQRATIVGTSGDDVLLGTKGADVIAGLSGDDEIHGRGGRDLICGGPGSDVLAGDGGLDRIQGGRGNDIIAGGSGNDSLGAGPAHDRLRGGRGFDFLFPGSGNDQVDGGRDHDSLELWASVRGVNVDLRAGRVKGMGADSLRNIEQVVGSHFDDVLLGSPKAEALIGLGGNDRLIGGGGPDSLEPGPGQDVVDGGRGQDWAIFVFSAHAVEVDLASGAATGEGHDELRSIENVQGSKFKDRLIGNSAPNYFIGEAPFDQEGDDMSGMGGDDHFARYDGDSSIDGGDGLDTVAYAYGVSADLKTGMATGMAFDSRFTDSLARVENIWGSIDEPNTITGDGQPNELRGGSESDTFAGGAGDDVLYGRGGDDNLDGGPDTDTIRGGPGIDTCLSGEDNSGCEAGALSFEKQSKSSRRPPRVRCDTATPCQSLVSRGPFWLTPHLNPKSHAELARPFEGGGGHKERHR